MGFNRQNLQMSDPIINIADVDLQPCYSGLLWWAQERILVVSDLHLEKGSAMARRGQLVPPYDTAATLARLTAGISRFSPRLVISLGDSFHDTAAGERIDGRDQEAIDALQVGRDWVWITGNHDPEIPSRFAGDRYDELCVDALTFRHEPLSGEAPGEIAGHLHPAAKVKSASRRFRRPCFADDGTRLIMPSFGAYTGGLNVLDKAYKDIFGKGMQVHLLGDRTLYRFNRSKLIAD